MYKDKQINKTIGKNISLLRKSLNLKQEAFASELNKILKRKYNINAKYDCKAISKWEMGQAIPKTDVLIAICKEFNLSLDELLKDEIKEVVAKSSFSTTDKSLLNIFLKNQAVCIEQNGKYVSAYAPQLYRYGQLSYLANNLIEYRAEMSKNFRFTNATKEVQIIVGIMDVNDDKRELHYLGNGDNDIISIENIPINYSRINIKDNNVIESITYNEVLNNNCSHIIKLGNGKTFVIDENCSNYDPEEYRFKEGNIPDDLEYYGLNKDEFDWTDYAYCKRDFSIDEENLLDCSGGGVYFYKKAGIFEVVLYGTIKCTDAQLVKVLADDYKHRLLNTLEKISDRTICNQQLEEVEKYLKTLKEKV